MSRNAQLSEADRSVGTRAAGGKRQRPHRRHPAIWPTRVCLRSQVNVECSEHQAAAGNSRCGANGGGANGARPVGRRRRRHCRHRRRRRAAAGRLLEATPDAAAPERGRLCGSLCGSLCGEPRCGSPRCGEPRRVRHKHMHAAGSAACWVSSAARHPAAVAMRHVPCQYRGVFSRRRLALTLTTGGPTARQPLNGRRGERGSPARRRHGSRPGGGVTSLGVTSRGGGSVRCRLAGSQEQRLEFRRVGLEHCEQSLAGGWAQAIYGPPHAAPTAAAATSAAAGGCFGLGIPPGAGPTRPTRPTGGAPLAGGAQQGVDESAGLTGAEGGAEGGGAR